MKVNDKLSMDDLTMPHYEKAARALGYDEFRDPGAGWANFARPCDKAPLKAADWAEFCALLEVMPKEWNGKQGY